MEFDLWKQLYFKQQQQLHKKENKQAAATTVEAESLSNSIYNTSKSDNSLKKKKKKTEAEEEEEEEAEKAPCWPLEGAARTSRCWRGSRRQLQSWASRWSMWAADGRWMSSWDRTMCTKGWLPK